VDEWDLFILLGLVGWVEWEDEAEEGGGECEGGGEEGKEEGEEGGEVAEVFFSEWTLVRLSFQSALVTERGLEREFWMEGGEEWDLRGVGGGARGRTGQVGWLMAWWRE
jgi:hypothetical protein